MHASGNDYVFIDERENYYTDYPTLAKKISDRHFGVGSDGLIVLGETSSADVRMTMFNADGSRGEICGNALRCIGKHLYGKYKNLSHDESEKYGNDVTCFSPDKDNDSAKSPFFRVLTDAGIKEITVDGDGEKFNVKMGTVLFKGEKLPPVGVFLMPFNGKEFLFNCAFIGNPHAVCIVENFDFDYEKLADELNTSGFFVEGANVEFVKLTEGGAEMRVIERGSGETLCCGSGSVSVAAVLCRNGLKNFGKIAISTLGGDITVDVEKDYSVTLSGDAEFVFEGKYFIE